MAEREPPRHQDDSLSEDSVQAGGKKEKSRRPASEAQHWYNVARSELTMDLFLQTLRFVSSG